MSPPMPRPCGFTNCVSPSIRSLKRRDAVGFQFRISAALSAKSRSALSSMPAISLRSTDRARACVLVASHGPVANPAHARAPSNGSPGSPRNLSRPLTPSDASPSPFTLSRNLAAAWLECVWDGAAADSTRGAAASPSTPSSMRARRPRFAPLPMYML
jgi:hypothetical protein